MAILCDTRTRRGFGHGHCVSRFTSERVHILCVCVCMCVHMCVCAIA